MARISEEGRWIQRRVYATCIATYMTRGVPIDQAIKMSLDDSAKSAVAFENRFPSAPIVDTTATPIAEDIGASVTPKGDARPSNGAKMHPGVMQNAVKETT